MTENQKKKKSAISWIKKSSLILTGIFLLYVIAGFWVIPPLLKPRLEKELSSQIGRKVTIEKIKLNPLILSATATNLTVYEIDEEPFAGFNELFVNIQLSSIFKWAVTFKEIRMTEPFGVLKLLPEKKLNIDDILAKFSQPKPKTDQKTEVFPVVISKLQVEDGKFSVEDLAGKEPIYETYSPITFTLENLSTLKESQGAYKFVGVGPNGGNYQLDGQLSVNPVRVEGSYIVTGTNLNQLWKHVKDQVSFQIINGTMGTSGNYSLEFVDGIFNAKLQNGKFELKNFQVTEKGKDKVFISLPNFSVQGISGDLKTQEIIVERVKTADAKIESWLLPDGTFSLQNLLLPGSPKSSETNKTSSTEQKTTASQPWYATINNIEMTNWNAVVEDRTLPKPVRFTLDNINVTIDDLSNKKNLKAKIGIVLEINKAGTVKVNGSAVIDPLMADLNIFCDKIALKSFQSYVDTAVNAQITKGTASSQGRILYKGMEGQPKIRFQGGLSLDGLEIKDRLQAEDFIGQKQLKASGIVLDIQPNKLHVANVSINKTYARLTIDQNGTVNVVQAFTPVDKKGEEKSENLLDRLVNFLILQIKGPMPMSIDLVKLDDFVVDFIDGSIRPPFATHLEINEGTMKGLSSDPSARADYKVEGTIDQSATIKSFGQMNPLNAMQYAKVDVLLKDFKLKPVSQYSGKYAGYKIAEGTLDLNLKYRVDDNKFTGDNIIVADQLTLGSKVDSPDATDLPVALGVALLKDANGRIILKVPVSGDVKAPQFDFGQTITSALTDVMGNIVSSPFSAIKAIGGFNGEELRFIKFEFGLSELSSRETKKLDTLAKFLNERTALTLGLEGTADPKKDLASMSGKQIKKGKPDKKQDAAKTQCEDLGNGQDLDNEQLKQLAQLRAEKVKAYLIQHGKVTEERVQLKPVQIKPTPNGDYGGVELFLSAQ